MNIFHLSDCCMIRQTRGVQYKSFKKDFISLQIPNNILYKVCSNLKLFICIIKHNAFKIYGGMEVKLHIYLTLALHRGKWFASCVSHFTPWERASSSNCIGDWKVPRAGLSYAWNETLIPVIQPGC